ncbi:MAG: GNAT family N-acetyltransferase [archaeon]
MKIIQFADYYNEITGNPMQLYANLVDKKKFDVEVFCSDKIPTKVPFDDSKSSLKIHRFKGKIFGAKCFFPGVIPYFFFNVKKNDLMHAHVLGFFSVFVSGYMKFFKKFSLVVTPDFDVMGKKQNIFLRLFNYFFVVVPAKKADLLLAFTEKEKNALIERFGFAEKKIKVLPIGIEWNKFRKEKNTVLRKKLGVQKKFVLLSVCYLSRKKNIEMIINSLKELPEQAVLVHIGGQPDKEYKKELDELILRLNLRQRVLFLGNKTLSELTEFYSVGDVFVNSGFNESYCIPIVEAMASGLPILTTKAGVAEEALEEIKNGFFIESKKDLAEKTILLLENPLLMKQMSENNDVSSKKFDWQKIISNLEQFYLSLQHESSEKISFRKANLFDFFSLEKIVVDDRKKFDNPLFAKGQKPVYSTWLGLKPFFKLLVHLIHPQKQVLFLEVNSVLAGVSIISGNLIEGFFINREFRGKGFGKKLLGYSIDFLKKEKKLVSARVGVQSSNDLAKSFYKKMGFKEKERKGTEIILELRF